jgi:hypothetical protein
MAERGGATLSHSTHSNVLVANVGPRPLNKTGRGGNMVLRWHLTNGQIPGTFCRRRDNEGEIDHASG